jgi:Xaa-Pro aminopeptidase
MFNKEIYKHRREVLKSKVASGIILLLGNEETGMNYAANTYAFRQDSSFLYYVGIDLPDLILMIDIDNNREILFGNEPTIDDIVWTGPTEALSDLSARAGISETMPYKKTDTLLHKIISEKRTVHFLPPYRGEHVLKLQNLLGFSPEEIKTKSSETLIKSIISMRLYKQPEEIAEMDKAVDISTEMHELFFKSLKPGITEKYAAGLIHGYALSSGNALSYPIILTKNGETLHIMPRNKKIQKGDLVICDAGAETPMHYAGDITRTAPASGKFSEIQKEMYNIVLETQLATIAACKPGVLFKDVHALAGKMILEGLKNLGIVKGNTDEALANDVHTLFFQCGLGHAIGLDVHDMENLGELNVGYSENTQKSTAFGWKSLRFAKALEPGFMLTVEPGIYFIPTLIDMWKNENKHTDFIDYTELEKFKTFGGIRVEDNILITQNGCRISGNKIAPKSVNEIEAFMQGI